jgi:hypothetical protein
MLSLSAKAAVHALVGTSIVELQILISTLVSRDDMELKDGLTQKLEIFERFNSNPGPLPIRIQRRQAEAQ